MLTSTDSIDCRMGDVWLLTFLTGQYRDWDCGKHVRVHICIYTDIYIYI